MKRAQSGLRGVFFEPSALGTERHPVTKVRGMWRIRWECRFGHLHRERVGPKALADQRVQERRIERLCPDQAPAPAQVLLRDAIAEYLRDSTDKRSHHEDERHGAFWTAQLGGRPLEEVTRGDLRRIKAARLQEVGPGTVNRQLSFLRRLYNVLIDDEVLTCANPARGGKRSRLFAQEPSGRVRFLSDEEEVALRAQLAPWEEDRVTVLLDTGLRRSEFLALRACDVSLKAKVLTIPRSKHGEARHVPLNSRVHAILAALPRPLNPTARVFPNSVGAPDERWVAKRFPAAVEAAELHNFRFHDLRHTFASRLVMAGVSLRAVQELGGWKSLSMVQRYAHLSPSHLHAAVEKLAVPPLVIEAGRVQSPS
jgi:integrase